MAWNFFSNFVLARTGLFRTQTNTENKIAARAEHRGPASHRSLYGQRIQSQQDTIHNCSSNVPSTTIDTPTARSQPPPTKHASKCATTTSSAPPHNRQAHHYQQANYDTRSSKTPNWAPQGLDIYTKLALHTSTSTVAHKTRVCHRPPPAAKNNNTASAPNIYIYIYHTSQRGRRQNSLVDTPTAES